MKLAAKLLLLLRLLFLKRFYSDAPQPQQITLDGSLVYLLSRLYKLPIYIHFLADCCFYKEEKKVVVNHVLNAFSTLST